MGEAPSRFDLDRVRLISPEHGHYRNLAQLMDSRTPQCERLFGSYSPFENCRPTGGRHQEEERASA